MTFIQMGLGLGLRLGDIRESGETGDSREEEDTQWRQVITDFIHHNTKNICWFSYFVRFYMK